MHDIREEDNPMKKILLLLLIGSLSLLALACGDDDSEPTPTPPTDAETPTGEPTEEPTDTPTSTPTSGPEEGDAPDGLYGHGKRTGVPAIDAILEAWEKGDIEALAALALLQDRECTTDVNGLGGPPQCPDGVADGSTVQVFQAARCEGYWAFEEGVPTLFQSFVEGADGEEYYLFAAWHDDGDEFMPAGYRISFGRTIAQYDLFSPLVVLNEDGRIAAYYGGCGPATAPEGADFVLEPKS